MATGLSKSLKKSQTGAVEAFVKMVFAFFLFLSIAAHANPTCPSLAGEYALGKCPQSGKWSSTVVLHQPNCHTLGMQRLSYDPTGKVSGTAYVNWVPVGNGRLLASETATKKVSFERIYERDALYVLKYELDKATNVESVTDVDTIVSIKGDNLLVDHEGFIGGRWLNLKNCGP